MSDMYHEGTKEDLKQIQAMVKPYPPPRPKANCCHTLSYI